MRYFYLNNQCFREEELKEFTVEMLENLLYELQEEIHRLASQKNEIASLPKSKKNFKTLHKLTSIKNNIIKIQDAQVWVGRIKKEKKSSLTKERDFYKAFYNECKDSLRFGAFDKINKKVSDKLNYSVNN